MSAPSQTHIDAMKDKALATLARTDGITDADADFVRFEGEQKTYGEQTIQTSRGNGQYVVCRFCDHVYAVYKVIPRVGGAQPMSGGGVMMTTFSVGLKRMKRLPKGLI